MAGEMAKLVAQFRYLPIAVAPRFVQIGNGIVFEIQHKTATKTSGVAPDAVELTIAAASSCRARGDCAKKT
jgi:hypothetical protein